MLVRAAPALGLAETQERRARDELVLDDSVERARARDRRVPRGQIARRQEHRPLAPAQRQPLGEIVDRMIAERDLGDVKRNARDVAPYRPRINPPGRPPRPGRERRKTQSNRSSSKRNSTRPPRYWRGTVRVSGRADGVGGGQRWDKTW